MSIASRWEELTQKVMNEEGNALRNLIVKFNEVKGNLTAEGIKEAEAEYSKVSDYLKSLQPKEYDKMDKLIKVQITEMKENLNKKLNIKQTKWELFLEEVNANNWKPIKEVVDYLETFKEGEQISQDIYEIVEEKIKSLRPYINKNLSPYDADWADKEFAKRIRIFKNRVEKTIEDGFGGWIRQLREAKGYSLKELERITGVTASYIHRIETGTRKTPSVQYLEKLALGLGVNPKDFLAKLNLLEGKTENKEVLTGFAETIVLHNFTINGKKVTKDQKEMLVEVYKKIISCKWTEETKIMDTMDIANSIDKFKKTI
jgi:Predicted transcriptional regulators